MTLWPEGGINPLVIIIPAVLAALAGGAWLVLRLPKRWARALGLVLTGLAVASIVGAIVFAALSSGSWACACASG
ncbi:hypothetical protein ACE2AJ_16880 [Aquihabitans daechungensis]|uniref:hypothetical protein n=1 Tax=Aquihabitans daechungensis TaxID=1052257 RepID=UPI003BA3DE92